MFEFKEYDDKDILKHSPSFYIVRLPNIDYIFLHMKEGTFSYESDRELRYSGGTFFEYAGRYFLEEEEPLFYA